MATKRFDENPALKVYAGTEVIPMQSKAGGTATDDSSVAVDDDVKITLLDAAGLKVHTAVVSAGVATLNCGNGLNRRHQVPVLTGNVTLALSNLAPDGYATDGEARIVQDATGGHSVTLPANWRPIGGSDTAVAIGPSAVTWLSFVSYDGVNFSYAMQERGA